MKSKQIILAKEALTYNDPGEFCKQTADSCYRDVFPYLDEETQDAVFYQEPEEEYEFILDSAPLLAQKMEKEITHLFHKKNSGPTELVGLMDTMNKLSCHLRAEPKSISSQGRTDVISFSSNQLGFI